MSEKYAYLIVTAADLEHLEDGGRFEGSPEDRAAGYIRLIGSSGLGEEFSAHFAERADLSVIMVDLEALGPAIRRGADSRGTTSARLYGALTLDTVIAYRPLEREDDGTIKLPVAG